MESAGKWNLGAGTETGHWTHMTIGLVEDNLQQAGPNTGP